MSVGATNNTMNGLAKVAGVHLGQSVPLAPLTTFRIGGPAEWLATVDTVEGLSQAWCVARDAHLPITILGAGSNLLVADQGLPGLVIRLGAGFDFVRLVGASGERRGLEVGAGCGCGRLVRFACEQGLAGVEPLAGVPGTIGGAIWMNAGGRQGAIGTAVARVWLWREGAAQWMPAAQVGFRYRGTDLPPEAIVLGAELSLDSDAPTAVSARVRQALDARRATQPLEAHSAGSTFKNPAQGHAGQLIEAAGCKGWREGQASVSVRHANFIVNEGGATAADVLRLIERVRAKVREASGVELELEIKVVGMPTGEARS